MPGDAEHKDPHPHNRERDEVKGHGNGGHSFSAVEALREPVLTQRHKDPPMPEKCVAAGNHEADRGGDIELHR